MSTEDRLRQALHAEVDGIDPSDGWARIEAQISGGQAMNRFRVLGAAAAAALVGIGAVAVLTQRDEDRPTPVITEPSVTTTEVAPSTTGPAPTSTTVVEELGPHAGILWSHSFPTPTAAALAFARDFLNMPSARAGGPYRAGDARSGEVVVYRGPTGAQATTISVRQFDGQWYVVAANAANLELDTPRPDARINSPVRLTGRSISFEGNVQVAVLRYDTTLQCTVPTDVCGPNPGVYANTFFTGQGTEKGPFDTTVAFTKPEGIYGYVVLWTMSAEDGTVSEATVRLVRFG